MDLTLACTAVVIINMPKKMQKKKSLRASAASSELAEPFIMSPAVARRHKEKKDGFSTRRGIMLKSNECLPESQGLFL